MIRDILSKKQYVLAIESYLDPAFLADKWAISCFLVALLVLNCMNPDSQELTAFNLAVDTFGYTELLINTTVVSKADLYAEIVTFGRD